MAHDIDAPQEIIQIASGQIYRDEVKPRPVVCPLEVAQLLQTAVVVVEAIDTQDLMTVTEQRLGEMRPDEACATGYKDANSGYPSSCRRVMSRR